MRKKISVSELCLGMFIEKLDGNWLDHPFWKSAFKLEQTKDLTTLQKSKIKFVWIDTDKGADTPIDTASIEPSQETTEEPAQVITGQPVTDDIHTSLEDELIHAKATLSKARESTEKMFQEARLGKSIQSEDIAPLVNEISESVSRNASAMLSLTRMKTKDDYTYMHSVAVCALMIALGKQMNYQGDLQTLGMAGLLHDIGKMAMPEDVLNKPGKLTDAEYDIMKSHPKQGWDIIKESFEVDGIVLDVCLHHHERIDGKGYPEKLAGEDISLVAKMASVCDVYDAITSERCYKKGWDPAEALKKMAEWKDGHFDDTIFNHFVKTVGIYPTGTLLKLKSGRLGIVTEQSEHTLLKPRIKVFYSSTSQSPIPAKIIELTRSQETIESIEEAEDWGFDRQKIMDILVR